jgi:hypothetical protein
LFGYVLLKLIQFIVRVSLLVRMRDPQQAEVSTTVVAKNIYSNSTWQDIKASMEFRKIMGDLCEVRGTNSGRGVVGMLEKQMESVGMPLWSDNLTSSLPAIQALAERMPLAIADASSCSGSAGDAVVTPIATRHAEPHGQGGGCTSAIHADPGGSETSTALAEFCPMLRQTIAMLLVVYHCCTDAGADVATARAMAASELALDIWKWWFDIDCLMHQYHLSTLWSLRMRSLCACSLY